MKKLNVIWWLWILFEGVLGMSCADEHGEYEVESVINLNRIGTKFMERVMTRGDWVNEWQEIEEVGTPMPNESIMAFGGGYKWHYLMPLQVNGEVNGLVVYPIENVFENKLPSAGNLGKPCVLTNERIGNDASAFFYFSSSIVKEMREHGIKFNENLCQSGFPQSERLSRSSDLAFPVQYYFLGEISLTYEEIEQIFRSGLNLIAYPSLTWALDVHYDEVTLYAKQVPNGISMNNLVSTAKAYYSLVKSIIHNDNPGVSMYYNYIGGWDMYFPSGGDDGDEDEDIGNQPPVIIKPVWTNVTHKKLLDTLGMRLNLSGDQLFAVQQGSSWCDGGLFDSDLPVLTRGLIHAINIDNLSIDVAYSCFLNYMDTTLQVFMNTGIYEVLGVVMHSIIDSFCPGHKKFQPHVGLFEDHAIWGDNCDTFVELALSTLQSIYDILTGPGTNEFVVTEAISCWEANYPRDF